MIRYYFIVFVRNLKRNKIFSLINLLGLTTGIVSTLLIYLFVQHELSYDKFHQKADQIYRVNQTFIWGEDRNQLFSSTGPGVAHAIMADIPEAKEITRAHTPGNTLVTYVNKNNEVITFDEAKILAVDSNFLSVFTFPLIKGSAASVLREPQTIVITESTAKRYFGSEDPVGKLLQVGNANKQTYEVTGVVKDTPKNSYIEFDMLFSMSSFPRVKRDSWTWIWTTFETFVVLDERAVVKDVETKLNALPRKYAGASVQGLTNMSFDDYLKSKPWNLYLQPFTNIHLKSGNIYNRLNDVGNIKILYILIGVVVFIILLSCINFMNLSTAQYTKRAKETSLRKVMGSPRWHLGLSFFMEAFLFCSLALLLGLVVTQVCIPLLNIQTGNNFELRLLSDSQALIVIGSLLVIMSILSGSYPAFFLSAMRPVEAMKGKIKSGKEGKVLRNGLVIFQFSISIFLIISTMVVFDQLTYLSQKDIGFERENLLVVERMEWVNDKETFIDKLSQIEGIELVSWCSGTPPNLYDGDQFKGEGNLDKVTPLNFFKGDEQYVPTLGLTLVVGRNFSKDSPADIQKVILNETAVKEFGWQVDESVIGKKVYFPGVEQTFEVLAVVKDFNYWALQAPIEPMGIFNIKNKGLYGSSQFAAIKISLPNTAAWQKSIDEIQTQWKQFAGDMPFKYEFVDQAFAASFEGELKFGQALSVFAALAILIASLGLLGMIIYTVELRTKEIGIRKVIGASVWNIMTLISKDYSKLILIAILLSIPVSIWAMNSWLEGFEYRVKISPLTFIFASLGTLIVAVLITSYHAIKAALTNPVDVLKDE